MAQCFEKSHFNSQKAIDAFTHRHSSLRLSRQSYQSILLDELKKHRGELHELKYPEFYQLLPDRENVKNYFIDLCSLDVDIDDPVFHLGMAIELNDKMKFFLRELHHVNEKLVKPRLDIVHVKLHFEQIISAMIPNPQISEQLWRVYNRFSINASGHKINFFLVEDLKDSMRQIFQQTFIHFKEILDGQPGHVIASLSVF